VIHHLLMMMTEAGDSVVGIGSMHECMYLCRIKWHCHRHGLYGSRNSQNLHSDK